MYLGRGCCGFSTARLHRNMVARRTVRRINHGCSQEKSEEVEGQEESKETRRVEEEGREKARAEEEGCGEEVRAEESRGAEAGTGTGTNAATRCVSATGCKRGHLPAI